MARGIMVTVAMMLVLAAMMTIVTQQRIICCVESNISESNEMILSHFQPT
jgi:hypothetical protein